MTNELTEWVVVTPALFIPVAEIEFRYSRSGGPGGQNVNRRETRVELLFDIGHSPTLTEEQRERLMQRLRNRIDSAGVLHLTISEHRSQLRNRQAALERFGELLQEGLNVPRERVATRPSRVSAQRRMEHKRRRASTKQMRRPVRSDEY